jgi:hypothetical protein
LDIFAKLQSMAKSIGTGNINLQYETEVQRGLLQQIGSKLMTGGQIDNLVSQKRISEASQTLTEVDSLSVQLSRDPVYRTCCEPHNNGVINPARNAALSKIQSAERQIAQDKERQEKAAAFSQGLQTMVASGQSMLDASRARSADYQPLVWQQSGGGSNMGLILGIAGGATVLLLLILLLRR